MNWLQEIAERLEGTSEAPWDIFEFKKRNGLGEPGYRISANHTLFFELWPCADGFVYGANTRNAQFIGHARTDIPDLLEFIKEALPVMEKLSGIFCHFCDHRPSYIGCEHGKARSWIAKHGKESDEKGE